MLSSAAATWGISGVDNASSVLVSGAFTIGVTQQNTPLSNAKVGYAYGIELDGDGSVEINLTTGVATPVGTGTQQATQANAVGTIATSGNATIVVTSPLITGSPLTVPVAVTNGDNAATWAGKVRTALDAVTAITDHFTVGGTSAAITLTAIVAALDDPTLNISLTNGTCTGITEDTESEELAAGIAPPKAYRIQGLAIGGDYEGKTLPTDLETYYGALFIHDGGDGLPKISYQNSDTVVRLTPGGVDQSLSPSGLGHIFGGDTIVIESPTGEWCKMLMALFCSRAP